MASGRDFLDFILGQLSILPDIDYRAMMGEFIIYYRGKVIGGIYDNRFLVKNTPSAQRLMPNAPLEIPYKGGKPMIMVEDVENQDLLVALFNVMYSELPETKRKKR